MSPEAGRLAAAGLLMALALALLAKGIIPALSRVDTDFPNYWTAARIAVDGGPTERLYDIPWFQDQMRRYRVGIPTEGKFSPFPPPTALLLAPLARLPPLDALRIVTLVSLACLAGSVILLAKVLSWRMTNAALLVLLSGQALLAGLRLGQPYIAVSFLCILGFFAASRLRPGMAGFCLGLFVPIKYFPLSLLLGFALRKRWTVVASGALTSLAVVLSSIVVLGWPIHAEFVSILAHHLVGRLDMQDPFATSFQSFDALFRQLFVFDASSNPTPLYAAPHLAVAALAATKLSLAAAALATLYKLTAEGESSLAPTLGVLGILTLLLAPATASYHMVLLWLPVGLMLRFALEGGARSSAYVLLLAYALIGFFPYALTRGFESRGALTIFAFPRLWLLLATFMAALTSVWRRPAC